jgi:hypothetical protein
LTTLLRFFQSNQTENERLAGRFLTRMLTLSSSSTSRIEKLPELEAVPVWGTPLPLLELVPLVLLVNQL